MPQPNMERTRRVDQVIKSNQVIKSTLRPHHCICSNPHAVNASDMRRRGGLGRSEWGLFIQPAHQGCSRRKRASEAAPEAVRQAFGGGCESGWGQLLSVTKAIEARTWRQLSLKHWKGRKGGGGLGGVTPPPPTVYSRSNTSRGEGVGMTPWCVLVCTGRRQWADRHFLPLPMDTFPPSAVVPIGVSPPFLFLLGLCFPLNSLLPFPLPWFGPAHPRRICCWVLRPAPSSPGAGTQPISS